MRKIIVVAVREYQAAVRTKAFLITLVAMPILFGGSIVAQLLLKDRVDTGKLYDAVAKEAGLRNQNEIFDDRGKQNKPRFLVRKVARPPDDPDREILELSDMVRNKELFGFVVIASDALESAELTGGSAISYYSNSPTYYDFHRWVSHALNDRVTDLRLREAGLDADLVAEATRGVGVSNLGLVSIDQAGNITEAVATNRLVNFLLPFGMLMLMFMLVLVSAQPLLHTVLEEKMQRIAEVLLGSITPFQLMMGKLLGSTGMSLTLGTVYLGGGFVAIHYAGYGDLFPTRMIWWFVLYQALAVLMFGSLYIAVGAAVTDLKEAQSLMLPIMIPIMVPMFVWMNVVKEPSSTFAVVLSLIPPMTPMLMLVRQTVPPGVPLWQPLLGILLVLLTTVACVFAAGRVFRVGILMQGKGASVRDMARWILRG